MIINPTAYSVYGIPPHYAQITWDNVNIPEPEKDRINKALDNIHPSVVFVQGTAAPLVNKLVTIGKIVRGIDIAKRLSNPFDEHYNPKADVILVHNVGKYTGKYEIANVLLQGIINHYTALGALIIIQSEETFSYLNDNWGIKVVNKLKLPIIAPKAWI